MALVSLVYVSRAAEAFSDEQLRDLLAVARDRNKELNVTGMLLYRDGFFIQALEGEDQQVEALYEKIKQDCATAVCTASTKRRSKTASSRIGQWASTK